MSDNIPAIGNKRHTLTKRAHEFTTNAFGTGGTTKSFIKIAIHTKDK
jgi:hypothetical protein